MQSRDNVTRDALLVLNAGSSSLKFSVFLDDDPPRLLFRGQFDGLLGRPRFRVRHLARQAGEKDWEDGTCLGHDGAVRFLLEWARTGELENHRIVAAGHHVVHGGTRFTAPSVIDARTLRELEDLITLAPMHQPHNLAVIKALALAEPALLQVACFDTAFHWTKPAVAQAFALPRRDADEDIVPYGVHGLAYEYVASVLPQFDSGAAAGRTVVVHLGNGASMCAMSSGQSVISSSSFIGFGDVLRAPRLAPGATDSAPNHGTCSAEAVEVLVYRIRRELGSLAAVLGGVDALVFTGAMGERAASIRARVCRDAAWLGLCLDEEANGHDGPCISRKTSRMSAWVIPTNEELMIAMHTRRVLDATSIARPDYDRRQPLTLQQSQSRPFPLRRSWPSQAYV